MKYFFIITTLVLTLFTPKSEAQVTVGTSAFGPFKDFKKGEYDIIKKKLRFLLLTI